MNRENNSVARYCELFKASGKAPLDFARYMLAWNTELCLRVLETIGSWPNSEPELAALQHAFP